VRSDGVVLATPGFDQHLRLLQGVEDLAVEELIPQPGIEAFDVAVFPGTAGRDVGGLGPHRGDPRLHRLGDELRPVVGPDMSGHATQDEQIRKHVDDVMRIQPPRHPDRQSLAGEFIDDVEHAQLAAVIRAVLDEIIGPDMVGPFRLQPDAGAVIQPQPGPLRLPLWHLQPLPAPDPLDALLVHQPAGTPQQRRDPPVAVAAILPGQGNDVGRQRRFVIRCLGDLALRRPWLAEHAAGKPLRYPERGHGVLHTIPAARRA